MPTTSRASSAGQEWLTLHERPFETVATGRLGGIRGAHADNFSPRAGDYGEYFREFLEFGATVSAATLAEATAWRIEFSERFRAMIPTIDELASPGGGVPFAATHEAQYGPMTEFDPILANVQFRFTLPADLAGTPTISLPCGVTADGLPYTIQLMGSQLDEPTLCRIGHPYEAATEWDARHPNV